jgi:hypothetical protein
MQIIEKPANWRFNDGGRKEAGYKGEARDCGARAVAIALELPYGIVWEEIWRLMKDEPLAKKRQAKIASNGKYTPDTGIFHQHLRSYLKSKGWKWVATMGIGTGCQIHLKSSELPQGRIICRVTRHFTAVVDGIINDTHDCTRAGTRCVYGYYIKA